MNRIIKFISIFLVIITISLPVLGENGAGSDRSSTDSGKSDSVSSDSGKSDSSMTESSSGVSDSKEKTMEMYDNGRRMREVEGMTGLGFIHSEDNSYGSYVTFKVDSSSGDVLNYGISGASIFDSIKISGFDFKSSTTEGSETKIFDKDGSNVIQIHDNPAAVIEIHAKDRSNLIFNLSQGVSASKEDSIVKLTAGNETDYIVSEKAKSINISGRQIIIDTSEGTTIFRASPVNMPHHDMEDHFMEEVRTKRAGAEVSVGELDNYSIVNYSDNVSITMDSIEPKHMRMSVNSSDKAGKFILMNIDNSSLAWQEGEKITLYLDNETMKEVMTEQDLYNASESSFWLNRTGSNKMEALLFIKNFSTRQVDIVVGAAVNQAPTTNATIGTTSATATPKTPGFGLVLGLAALAALYTVRRKI